MVVYSASTAKPLWAVSISSVRTSLNPNTGCRIIVSRCRLKGGWVGTRFIPAIRAADKVLCSTELLCYMYLRAHLFT